MRQVFDSGATRARAQAWGLWLFFGTAWAAVAYAGAAGSAWSWLGLFVGLALGSWLILVRRRPRRIPVLNYHSVSAHPEWLQIGDRVSLTPPAFERQLAYLKRHGYQSLFISEVNRVLAGADRLETRGKYVALTFDDGYADNWIAAFPLLRKYGMKATLFVSTGFIADAVGCRPTIGQRPERAWDTLDWSGYLTWPELRAMQASGLVEIQSHGRSHTRVFAGPELRGFVGPGKPNLWLLWNMRPETRRCWWRELAADRSLWGHPVFRQTPALAHRAWRPDPEAVARMLSLAQVAGGVIFTRPDWEKWLSEEWQCRLREHGDQGNWESEEEYERRVGEELREAKGVLERELGVKVDTLCWPENAFSAAGEKVARRLGHAATVSNGHTSRNVVGEAPDRIVRVFIGSHALGFRCPQGDFLGFVLELKVFEGWYIWYPLLAVIHLAKKGTFAARRRCLCRRDYSSIWA